MAKTEGTTEFIAAAEAFLRGFEVINQFRREKYRIDLLGVN